MAITSKPAFHASDIWANSSNAANKQKPNQAKLDTGWVYGEKPPHNEFNWWWELVGKMLVHIQEHGTPAWDDETPYRKGAIAWHNDGSWISKSGDNVGHVPAEGTYWTAVLTGGDVGDIPQVWELDGKDLLYVVNWDIGNSYLHLNQVHVTTAS